MDLDEILRVDNGGTWTNCVLLKLTRDRHEASRALSATAKLLVAVVRDGTVRNTVSCKIT